MKIGIVKAATYPERKAPCLGDQTFLTVALGQDEVIAADHVGAAVGEQVLVVTGPAASKLCMSAPVDAAVVAVLRPSENNFD